MDNIAKKPKKKQVSDSRDSQIEDLKGQLARTLADYDNLQKRVAREKEEGKYLSKLVVISRLLPVFDMFSDALKHSNDAGLGIAMKVLTDTLKDEGIEEIAIGDHEKFNHELHEAIEVIESEDHENDEVAEVVLKGYKFTDGPVIRHTKVKVFKNTKINS